MRVGIHADPVNGAAPVGAGAYVRCLIEELLDDPHEKEDLRLLLSSGAEIPAAWPRASVVRLRRPLGLPIRASYAVWNALRRPRIEGLDVVHATSFVVPPANGAALVATIPDGIIDRPQRSIAARWRRTYMRGLRIALDEARVLCALSQATRRTLVDDHGAEPDRVIVTPPAGTIAPGDPEDRTVFARFGIRKPYVLHVGAMEPYAKQPRLIRSFAAARLPAHQLVIAGPLGSGERTTRAAAADAGGRDRVVATGPVDPPALAALYADADAFASPSDEAFATTLIEALSYGVPAVVTSDDAALEVGRDAVVGVEPGDASGLREALIAVCTDDAIRSRLSAASRQAAARYSWSRTAAATRTAWRRAVEVS